MKQRVGRVFGISLTHARARKRARTHSLTQRELFFAKGSKRSRIGYEGSCCSCPPRILHAYSTHCLTIPSPDETVSINRQIPSHPVPCARIADGIRKNNFVSNEEELRRIEFIDGKYLYMAIRGSCNHHHHHHRHRGTDS